MRLRLGLGLRNGSAPSYNPQSLYSPLVYLDSTQNVTGTTSVTAWGDFATPANFPSLETAQFGDKPGVFFDNGSSEHLISNLTAAQVKGLSDGTGITVFLVFKPHATAPAFGTLLDTLQGTNANTGFALWYYGTDQAVQVDIGNGAGSAAVNQKTANNTVVKGTKYILTFQYKEAESPEWQIRLNGTQLNSGNSAVAPSSADPAGKLYMGTYTNGTSQAGKVYVGHLMIVASYLSAAQIATHEAWATARWGI